MPYPSVPFLSQTSLEAGLHSLSVPPHLSGTPHLTVWRWPPLLPALGSCMGLPMPNAVNAPSPQFWGPVRPLCKASFLGLLDPLPWCSLTCVTHAPSPQGRFGLSWGSELPPPPAASPVLSSLELNPLSAPPHTALVQSSPGLSPEHHMGLVGDISS